MFTFCLLSPLPLVSLSLGVHVCRTFLHLSVLSMCTTVVQCTLEKYLYLSDFASLKTKNSLSRSRSQWFSVATPLILPCIFRWSGRQGVHQENDIRNRHENRSAQLYLQDGADVSSPDPEVMMIYTEIRIHYTGSHLQRI